MSTCSRDFTWIINEWWIQFNLIIKVTKFLSSLLFTGMSIILDSFSLFCWLNKLPHCRVTELSCSACVSPSSCQCVVRHKASGLEVYYWCSHRLERQEEEEWEEEWSALVCTALLGVSCEFIKLLILSCSTFVTYFTWLCFLHDRNLWHHEWSESLDHRCRVGALSPFPIHVGAFSAKLVQLVQQSNSFALSA